MASLRFLLFSASNHIAARIKALITALWVFGGTALELEVNGKTLATGVSDQRGSVPRFGETVLVVDDDASVREVLDGIIGCGHSRIPVYEGTIDNIVGLIYAKDLLKCWGEGQDQVQVGANDQARDDSAGLQAVAAVGEEQVEGRRLPTVRVMREVRRVIDWMDRKA